MKYKPNELLKAKESLLWSLNYVTSTGLCLVWICSLLFCRTATLIGTQYAASRGISLNSVPESWYAAVVALTDFRNEYVHSATMYIKPYLQDILAVDLSIWDALFDYIEAPANAIAVFHKWYDSGVIE